MADSLDQLIQQLRNPDAEQRKQAIRALANSKNPAALEPLGWVYNHDPDPALRDLALKAGRYIRQSMGPTSPGAASGAARATGQRSISEQDRALAKSLLSAATDYHLQGDTGRAIENLGKSLALNPEPVNDTFVMNLIMSLTNMTVEQALPWLLNPDQREKMIAWTGGKRKLKREQVIDGRVIKNVTWNRILMDLGLYWIISAVSAVITLFFMVGLMRDMISEMGGQNIFWYTFINELENAIADNFFRILLSSLVQSIGSTFMLVILLLVIHYTAVLFFGGEGTMEYFFRRVIPLLTVFTAALTVLLVVFLLIGSAFAVWFLVPMILGASSIGFFVYMADVVGKAYNFGFLSGCISVVLGVFIFGALWNLFAYSLGLGF